MCAKLFSTRFKTGSRNLARLTEKVEFEHARESCTDQVGKNEDLRKSILYTICNDCVSPSWGISMVHQLKA